MSLGRTLLQIEVIKISLISQDTYECKTSNTFSGHNFAETIANARVHFWVCLYQHLRLCFKETAYLFAALYDIEGTDSCVSKTASEDTASHAFCVVAEVVDV